MPNPPDTGNIFGATSNVNLTDIVKLNFNPFDIPKPLYSTLSSWNAFQKYLQDIKFVRDPKFNKNQEDTNKIINDYNNSITNPNFQKITQDAIIAAQTFHKKSDPKVQIDGWVGSQTSQLQYPPSLIMFEGTKDNAFVPLNPKGFIPILWGYKRFVIPAQFQIDYGKKGLYTPQGLWVQYDENIHKSTLQTNVLQNTWYVLNQDTEITRNAAQLELQRQSEKIKTTASNTVTNIKLAINNAKSSAISKL
jgi:hypothetical protein